MTQVIGTHTRTNTARPFEGRVVTQVIGTHTRTKPARPSEGRVVTQVMGTHTRISKCISICKADVKNVVTLKC